MKMWHRSMLRVTGQTVDGYIAQLHLRLDGNRGLHLESCQFACCGMYVNRSSALERIPCAARPSETKVLNRRITVNTNAHGCDQFFCLWTRGLRCALNRARREA